MALCQDLGASCREEDTSGEEKTYSGMLVPPKLKPKFLFEFFTFILEKFILLCKGTQLLIFLQSLAFLPDRGLGGFGEQIANLSLCKWGVRN